MKELDKVYVVTCASGSQADDDITDAEAHCVGVFDTEQKALECLVKTKDEFVKKFNEEEDEEAEFWDEDDDSIRNEIKVCGSEQSKNFAIYYADDCESYWSHCVHIVLEEVAIS